MKYSPFHIANNLVYEIKNMCTRDNEKAVCHSAILYALKMLLAYYVLNTFLGIEVTINKGQSQPTRSSESKGRKTTTKQMQGGEVQQTEGSKCGCKGSM